MSADNGIYILKTKRTALEEPKGVWTNNVENFVYRVAYASAIDNFDYYANKQLYNLGAYMQSVWGTSAVYTNEVDALEEASSLFEKFEKHDQLEYGISMIDASELIFFGDH